MVGRVEAAVSYSEARRSLSVVSLDSDLCIIRIRQRAMTTAKTKGDDDGICFTTDAGPNPLTGNRTTLELVEGA